MAKVTPRDDSNKTITVKTQSSDKIQARPSDWWNAGSKKDLAQQLISTAAFLKEQNNFRYRAASTYARLYGNLPLTGTLGANLVSLTTQVTMPSDRPTMSVITSCTDTIVSRLTQSKPRPIFLTDNGDYKQRNLAKQMNQFISGEMYQTHAHRKGKMALRDACVFGTGVIKVLEDQDKRVSLERRLATQLLVDANEAFLGDPRQLYELQLVDRQILLAMFPQYRALIERAENAYPDQNGKQGGSVSDQLMVVEGWRLPSSKKSNDGMHAIAIAGSMGLVGDETWTKDRFPFAFQQYSLPQVGFWGQSLAERQLGNQSALNRLLITTHKAINLVGVPRVFLEEGSKVVKAHLNDEVGSIVTYRGTKPIYEVAPCMPQEVYQEIERITQRAYQEEGISMQAASSVKPAGLNSGEAIREYDDIQTDRLADLSARYEDFYVDLAYLMIDKAVEIAERDGKYDTVYPGKDGTKAIDLPAIKHLKDDPYVIQCFDMASLPKDPSGRAAKITEWVQAGLYSPQEGRRLMGLSDTEQVDKLLNAPEERILQQLDNIVESGDSGYTPPDPFTDIAKAKELLPQYYNLYGAAKLEESKMQLLRNWWDQLLALEQQASAPPPGAMPPQANPMPAPQSDMIPNVPGGAMPPQGQPPMMGS